jgi:hypothetical protein
MSLSAVLWSLSLDDSFAKFSHNLPALSFDRFLVMLNNLVPATVATSAVEGHFTGTVSEEAMPNLITPLASKKLKSSSVCHELHCRSSQSLDMCIVSTEMIYYPVFGISERC